MSEGLKQIRLKNVLKEFNVGLKTIVKFLEKKGFVVEENPNTKISEEIYALLVKEFQSEKIEKEKSRQIGLNISFHETVFASDTVKIDNDEDTVDNNFNKDELIIHTKIDIDHDSTTPTPVIDKQIELKPEKKSVKERTNKSPKSSGKKNLENQDKNINIANTIETVIDKDNSVIIQEQENDNINTEIKDENVISVDKKETLSGIKVLGKIDIDEINKKSSRKKEKFSKTKHTEAQTEPSKSNEQSENIIKEEITEDEKLIDTITDETKVIKDETLTDTDKIENEVKDDIITEQTDNNIINTSEQKISEIIENDYQAANVSPIPKEKEAVTNNTLDNFIETQYIKLKAPKIINKITLEEPRVKKEPSKEEHQNKELVANSIEGGKIKKRKRIQKGESGEVKKVQIEEFKKNKWKGTSNKSKKSANKQVKVVIDEEQVQQHIKETLAKLTAPNKSKAVKYRRAKRELISHLQEEEKLKLEKENKILKVTEFVTVNDIANMMNVPVNNVIQTCLDLGLFVSINQRLDAEYLDIVAAEFGYTIEFVSADLHDVITQDEPDDIENLVPRAPIVTVMGHVDHGKTSLLDYIRKSNVIAGEAGGITQHIGAYEVVLENGKKITFLDTPGHEAFTAMRARGAKITDVAIIVIAADDSVMPQTKEAINHALAAGVPMVFAINKIDKPNANPEKIKEELAQINILVEDWNGKYQCQEISAKKGTNVDLLLDKVLLEAELMDLKANPNKPASGTVIESSLDKGRGYVAKVLVQNGTLKTGDMVLSGCQYGRVKAMYNERNHKIEKAGPSTPLLLLGLNGAPQAGDTFKVMNDEKETKTIAMQRLRLQREQGIRTQKHITLDEIGRRIVIGDFKELNIIVKADVDGSVEALSDAILKLSTPEVQVNVIHKSVGAINDSDVLLASASNAVIIGFQVRPTPATRKLAEQEQIDIRLYSVIYNAINEIKTAIEGMLSPEIEEKITANVEVREIFTIHKTGTVAGCYVLDGKINKSSNIRVIRDGIVIYTGKLASLKRFKEDVREVPANYECGLSIQNFNDIKVGDIIESYEEIEVKRKL